MARAYERRRGFESRSAIYLFVAIAFAVGRLVAGGP
jgi:hypothetical protein